MEATVFPDLSQPVISKCNRQLSSKRSTQVLCPSSRPQLGISARFGNPSSLNHSSPTSAKDARDLSIRCQTQVRTETTTLSLCPSLTSSTTSDGTNRHSKTLGSSSVLRVSYSTIKSSSCPTYQKTVVARTSAIAVSTVGPRTGNHLQKSKMLL